jgi:peptide-methionine (S)-S-oxide reductase
MEAARALVECGHPMDLISCVGIDRLTELEQFAAEADYELLGKALAIAAVLGKSEATRILIRHGADVQRFNPAGFHGHTTALHQAIWHGHVETARILLEAGASTAVLDTVYKGTPLDWAKYAKRPECEALLAEFS